MLTAYLLSASVCTPIVGRIGDRIGKKRALVVVLVALSFGSMLTGVASGMGMMLTARVIQGIGGGVVPLAFGIIRDEFPESRMRGAIGSIASLIAVGAGVGLVIAGPLMELLGYRWLFFLPMIVTAIAAVATLLLVPESLIRSPDKTSLVSAVMMSAWLIALLVAISQGARSGWNSWRTIGLASSALALAAAWVALELRSMSLLVDMNIMRRPAVWTANLVSVLVGFVMYAAYGFLPQFVQTSPDAGYGFAASVTESGLILLPWTVMSFVAGLSSSRLIGRFGAKRVIVSGTLLAGCAMTGFVLMHDHMWQLYVVNSIMGLGVGIILAPVSTVIVAAVPPDQTGVAAGVNANIRTVGGSIGTGVMAAVSNAALLPQGIPAESGYVTGFVVLAVIMLLAAAVAANMPSDVGDLVIRQEGGCRLAQPHPLRGIPPERTPAETFEA